MSQDSDADWAGDANDRRLLVYGYWSTNKLEEQEPNILH